MERIFTKDCGTFKKGMVKDYPLGTWTQIAASANKKLNTFTTTVDAALSKGIKT